MIVESTYKLPDRFKTSIEVLNKVLNMPVSTIEHELKKHNYQFHDQSSNCIDEKMLDIFAEKFCKNLKRYFEGSVQNLATLSYEESSQFYEFAQTYSKTGHFTKSWRNIDKVAIKDDFLRQIFELTTRPRIIRFEISESQMEACLKLAESIICTRDIKRESPHVYKVNQSDLNRHIESTICRCDDESLRVFDAVDSFLLNPFINKYKYDLNEYLKTTEQIRSYYESISETHLQGQDNFSHRVFLLDQIKRSLLYLSRLKRNTKVPINILYFQRIYRSARFHIVSDDGAEDEIKYPYSLLFNLNFINPQKNKYEKENKGVSINRFDSKIRG